MWIFFNDSFISVVAHKDQPGKLLVRGRFPGDIEKAIPGARVTEGEGTDYRFRAVVSFSKMGQALASKLWSIDYGNFKSSVTAKGRHDTYMAVWDVMRDAQDELERAEIRAKGRKKAPASLEAPQYGVNGARV